MRPEIRTVREAVSGVIETLNSACVKIKETHPHTNKRCVIHGGTLPLKSCAEGSRAYPYLDAFWQKQIDKDGALRLRSQNFNLTIQKNHEVPS